jgi:hypothetical protein
METDMSIKRTAGFLWQLIRHPIKTLSGVLAGGAR